MADWLHGLTVGDWYQASDEAGKGLFELVAVDVKNEVVLVQHYDGTLEEFDFNSWMEMGARPAAAPEDWSGAMDADKSDTDADGDYSGPGRREDPLDVLDQRFS